MEFRPKGVGMFLGAYYFDGDPGELIPAYDRLLAMMPPGNISFHACVVREDGITIYDACPSREVFGAFSTSADFAAAVASVGLPTPRVEQLGDVHVARASAAITA